MDGTVMILSYRISYASVKVRDKFFFRRMPTAFGRF